MKYYVYILECKDKSYYTGITWNVEKRVYEHNQSVRTPIQPSRRPVILVYKESFGSKVDAAKREEEIKGWRREKKKELISGLR